MPKRETEIRVLKERLRQLEEEKAAALIELRRLHGAAQQPLPKNAVPPP